MSPWETGTNAPSDSQIAFAEDLVRKLDRARLLGAERMRRRLGRARTKQELTGIISEALTILNEYDADFGG